MKPIPLEARKKVSISATLSPTAVARLKLMSELMHMNRSAILEDAVDLSYRFFLEYGPDPRDWLDDDPLPPDSENPAYTPYYEEEDL